MSFVCLWSPAWRTVAAVRPQDRDESRASGHSRNGAAPLPEIAAALLARAPRVAAGGITARGVLWADAGGFSTHGKAELAKELIAILARRGLSGEHRVRAGVADTPIAAELAAVHGGARAGRSPANGGFTGGDDLTIVPVGTDRAYVALFPLEVLHPDPRLPPLLFGIGVSTCGELAALDRESVEVRLGATAVPLWKLARADDPRLIFSPAPPEAPHASLDWVEYALRDPMRLLFVLNNLIERVCTTLAATGEGAREITIEFALTNRAVHVEVIRAARPTINRRTWVRLVRTRVEQVKLAAAVTGIAVQASKVAAREAPQGDLFDRGLASREATEDAVARLIEDQGEIVVAPQNSAHPLLDERTTWVPQKPAAVVRETYAAELTRERRSTVRLTPLPAPLALVRSEEAPGESVGKPKLLLQMAPAPLAITVEAAPRRDHLAPVRYRDADGWHEIVNAAGPERVSGRTWDGEQAYAREYFRCVTREGVLVWLYRDARERTAHPARTRSDRPGELRSGRWYLHGWWD